MVILSGRFQSLSRLDQHPVGHPVEALGTIHRQPPHRPRLFIDDCFEVRAAHGFSPLIRLNRGARRSTNEATPSAASGCASATCVNASASRNAGSIASDQCRYTSDFITATEFGEMFAASSRI